MLILQSLKYQGCGNQQQQQPKNAMDATTVNMEPGTTTLMQSPAVTQVGSLQFFALGQACRLDIFMKTHENSRRKKLKLKSLKAKTQELSP